MSTQEVVKEQGNLLEVSHFAGTQIHRALAHEKGTGLGAAVAMLEALIVIVSGYAAYSGRDFLSDLVGSFAGKRHNSASATVRIPAYLCLPYRHLQRRPEPLFGHGHPFCPGRTHKNPEGFHGVFHDFHHDCVYRR